MSRVLVLGGTAWLGARVAAAWRGRGAEVTCLARGSAGPAPAGARLVAVDRTDPGAYDAVAGHEWDEVVELSYAPALVGGALDALAARAQHWTLVSTVSVYAGTEAGADESAPLLPVPEPIDPDDYGTAKVAAEEASRQALGDRLLVARSGLIGGPGDGSDRYGYWVARAALAQERDDGPVLAPSSEDRWAQVVDVDDLATWLVAAGEAGEHGTVDAVGPSVPFGTALALAAEVAGYRGEVVTAPDDWLLERGVAYWAGPRSLPLWLPLADAGMARRDGGAFRTSLADLGLSLSSPEEVVQRTLEDERRRGLDRVRRSGLARDEELALVAELAGP